MKELLLIAIGSALVNNVVLSQFLGICPFLGVSKRVETSAGMGAAVIFVITIASAVASLIYDHILVRFGMEYLQTIVFILVSTVCRNVPEEKHGFPVSVSGRIPSADHDKLCCSRCCINKRTEDIQLCRERCQRCWYRGRIYDRYRTSGRRARAH